MRLDAPIEGENVRLRTLAPEEAGEAYLGWLHDPEVTALLEVRHSPPRSVAALSAFIQEANESEDSLLLGIFPADGEAHVGNIKLGPVDWHHEVGDIGFLIGDRTHWGKGLASQAIALITSYAFSELNLAKVTAGCYASNEGSRRALLKAGFVEEGRRPAQWKLGASRQDGLLFGRLNPVLAEAS